MFGNTTEKRVVRGADKIVSLKEDIDALSWGRVLELGKHLQEDAGLHEDCADCARELVTIAQSNLSLYARLGIDPAPAPSHVMASGVEVIEGGMAEAALEKHENHIDEKPIRREETVASEESVADKQTSPSEQMVTFAEEPTLEETSVLEEPDECDFEEAANAANETIPLFKPAEVAPVPDPVPAPVAEVAVALDSMCAPVKAQPSVNRGCFSRIKNLYESRDGGLCLFEDEHGHLVAVDASKLA